MTGNALLQALAIAGLLVFAVAGGAAGLACGSPSSTPAADRPAPASEQGTAGGQGASLAAEAGAVASRTLSTQSPPEQGGARPATVPPVTGTGEPAVESAPMAEPAAPGVITRPVPAAAPRTTAVPEEPTATPEPTPAPATSEPIPPTPEIVTPPGTYTAPEFRGIVQWINSDPMTMEELRGKVVLIDFWTYSCINCQRTLPYIRDWHDKYGEMGLVVVGVHAPEFQFEHKEENVRQAVIDQDVTWAVAMDNGFQTWRAYQNRWWPHKFLIDQQGTIRFHHIGEGAYRETELHIRNLLVEAGVDVSGIVVGGVTGG